MDSKVKVILLLSTLYLQAYSFPEWKYKIYEAKEKYVLGEWTDEAFVILGAYFEGSFRVESEMKEERENGFQAYSAIPISVYGDMAFSFQILNWYDLKYGAELTFVSVEALTYTSTDLC